MTKKKKVVKKRFKKRNIIKIIVVLLLVGISYTVLSNIEISRVIIKGNTYVSDYEIMKSAELIDYPKLLKISRQEIREKIMSIDYVNDVKVRKYLWGTIELDIDEASPLFYNRSTHQVVLANEKEIDSQKLEGIPTLINYVPDTLYKRLIKELKDLNPNVLKLISEIEYQPWKSNDVVIDDTRFYLRMTDQNQVYVNLIHMEKMNNYMEIYTTLENKKGFLYLDSSSDKISFSLDNKNVVEP